MKGIILAGGAGTRLSPLTIATSKQLLPIYDKPMIHYPLFTLMAAGIRDILIICNPAHLNAFQMLLSDGSKLGIKISYEIQNAPNGIAEAFIIGEHFLAGKPAALILGDNLFHGAGLGRELANYKNRPGAQVFAYSVANPSQYGVVEFSNLGKVISITEKPNNPRSQFAVTGLYFYDETVVKRAKSLSPSSRGELEISDLNNSYLSENLLSAAVLPRGTAWFDTGSFENLHDASSYVRILEMRQGIKVASLEEISWRQGWINESELVEIANCHSNAEYSSYLKKLITN